MLSRLLVTLYKLHLKVINLGYYHTVFYLSRFGFAMLKLILDHQLHAVCAAIEIPN